MVRLLKPSLTPSKRAVIDWMRVHNRFSAMVEFSNKIVRSQRARGSESSHGPLFNQEDSKQAQKYLRKTYGHPDR